MKQVVWKLLVGILRFWIIVLTLKGWVKFQQVPKVTKEKIEELELLIILDVLWSSIPLGVLTLLEMCCYHQGVSWLEYAKLTALAVDFLTVTYLLYFRVMGFGHSGHSDEHQLFLPNDEIN